MNLTIIDKQASQPQLRAERFISALSMQQLRSTREVSKGAENIPSNIFYSENDFTQRGQKWGTRFPRVAQHVSR